MFQIGEITKLLAISADTLRYYEKIKLLPHISRNTSGLRQYSDYDISLIKFIKRAQRMKFSLAEIAQLVDFRKSPLQAQPHVRKLLNEKLQEIDLQVQELKTLRSELQLLVNLCTGDKNYCPILKDFEDTKSA
ncbi:MAG: heavy metal-responsive transcriptional regulator [Proteobacteria bacterium]|nr:heavy metal-responsive transcriptional regulator [Pseudomonadota bacterium]